MATTAEVAAVFGKSKDQIERLAKSGQLRFIRTPGGQYRFRLTEVLADLAGPPPDQEDE